MTDYRDMLKDEFERRRGRNAFYSLRAYARDLRLAPPRLSEILSGKKGLSAPAAAEVATRLGLSAAETATFLLSVKALHSRSPVAKQSASAKLAKAVEARETQAPLHSVVVHWTTEATQKLAERTGFKPSVAAIAKAFGIPPYLAETPLRYLERAGLIKGVAPAKRFIAHRLKGKRLNVDYEQILEQARRAFVRAKGGDLFEHEPLLLPEDRLVDANALLRKLYADLRKLQSTDRTSRLVYVATQLFNLEHQEKETP
jgi:plasmid maintenance system antidote protein VapI